MLFDKGKITNQLQHIKLERDRYGRIQKNRRLSVGERLINVADFSDRIRSLTRLSVVRSHVLVDGDLIEIAAECKSVDVV